jgi:uncharacterized protein involved in response to NO
MAAIPRYRPQAGPAILSAGFRPFFLLAALWACLAIPASIAFVTASVHPPAAFPPIIWHVHEMAFGFGGAVVAGFLLTAIPNWTGRMPLQGGSLAFLALLWLVGRIALSPFVSIGPNLAAALDLSFPAAFLVVVAREIIVGRNWRNLPIAGALASMLLGNLLTHLEAMSVAETAEMGNRIGVATLLMLIALIGGRIVPSFTHNWLAKQQPAPPTTTPFDLVDRAALAMTSVALLTWAATPQALVAPWLELAAGATLALRLARWRGAQTLREPLLWVLHLGYGWLALGLLLLGFNSFAPILPQTTALHALTVGAIGTMTLAVMTRASLGHTGRPLVAGAGTTAIYISITIAATLRLLAPLFGDGYMVVLSLAGAAWSAAFGLFVLLYARPLLGTRVSGDLARPI